MEPQVAPTRVPPRPPRPPAPPTTGGGGPGPYGGDGRDRRAVLHQRTSLWRWVISAFGELRRVTWPQPLSAVQNVVVVSLVLAVLLVLIVAIDVGAQQFLSRIH